MMKQLLADCNLSWSFSGQRKALIVTALAGILLSITMSKVFAADPDRGEALYNNHCQSCHSDTLHNRENRKVEDRDSLYAWIVAWSTHAGLFWSEDEYDDVAEFMNSVYYQFDVTAKP